MATTKSTQSKTAAARRSPAKEPAKAARAGGPEEQLEARTTAATAPARRTPQDRQPKRQSLEEHAAEQQQATTADRDAEFDEAMTELEEINERTVDVTFEGAEFTGCKLEPFNDWRVMEAQATGQFDPALIYQVITESIGPEQYALLKKTILAKHDGKRIPNADVMRFFYAVAGSVESGN